MRNNYCIIMAGGVGSRFWPLSRIEKPKQFIDILGVGKSLLQLTFDRFKKVCPVENILVVTNKMYKNITLEQLPELSVDQVLLEPIGRNTAPCIEYANFVIAQKNKNANIIVTPADHLILNENEFVDVMTDCLKFVDVNDNLLTVGITPTKPETGYGYIQSDSEKVEGEICKVKTFVEKPDLETAKVFIDSGDFLWNSGIFIWSLKAINDAFDEFLPEIHSLFLDGEGKYGTDDETAFIEDAYSKCKKISIDYGIMEKSDNVYIRRAVFGWSDMGTWNSMYEYGEKDESNNCVTGENVYMYDSQNCVVRTTGDKVVVVQGLDDCIVAESDDVILICKQEQEKKIKHYVNEISIKSGDRFI